MNQMRKVLCTFLLVASAAAIAADESPPKADPPLPKNVLTMKPKTQARVTQDHIAVHRIDIVDDRGTIRMTLAASTPAPIVGGVQYKRAFDVSGLTYYDALGNERGGLGVADIPGGAVVAASDHENIDAIGWRVMPDGSILFAMNQKPPVVRDPVIGNHMALGIKAPSRIRLEVAADGTPAIALADKDDHARLRLTLTPEGYGAIEFVDAAGHILQTIAPESSVAKTQGAN
jgi:hypothetical protein